MSNIYDRISEERKRLQAEGNMPEWFSSGGWQLFKERYLYQANNPREQYMRIASTLAAHTPNPSEWKWKFFNIMWKGWLSPSTPVLANTGTSRGMPVSCAGNSVADNLYDIYYSKLETAMLTKMGFGTASYLGDIRPRGSGISDGGKASGLLPIIEGIQNNDMEYVAQGTSRRGSWAGYLPIDHGDFWEILHRLEAFPDGNNIGWCLTDDFVKRLVDRETDAIERYQAAMAVKMTTGKGYFFFPDKANRQRPQCYVDHGLTIKSPQLCNEIMLFSDADHTYTCQPDIAPLIKEGVGLTTLGNISVGDRIWSKEGWTEVTGKVSSGVKQVKNYSTVTGQFIGTEDHRIVQKGEKVEVKDANTIDFCPSPETVSKVEINPEVVLNGLLLGDGTVRNGKINLCVGENDQDYYDSEISSLINKGGYKYFRGVSEDIEPFVDVSENTFNRDFDINSLVSDSDKVSFLRGLYSANGSAVPQEDGGCHIILTQTSKNIAEKVRLILQSLGFSPKLYKTSGKTTEFENGDYLCKDRYDVKILKNDEVRAFGEVIGFIQKYKMDSIHQMPKKKSVSRKVSNDIHTVEDMGEMEVYHLEVDNDSHTYWTGGLDVSNCVLASLNAAKWNEWKDTDTAFVATVFLDCVVQEFIERAKNIPGLEKAVETTKKGRALGLGVCGFHTYLLDNGIPYESFEAQNWNMQLFKHVREEADKATEWSADQWGEPEWCKGYGRANTHVLAIAPTKSTALIMGGISEGIGPVTAYVYTQRTPAGEVDRIDPSFLNYLKDKGLYTKDRVEEVRDAMGSVQGVDWMPDEDKRIFKTAFELDQFTVLRMASTRAQHIDQWQSLNLFFAAGEDEKYIDAVHRHAILDENILGLYYVYSKANLQASKDRGDECAACQ